MTKIQRRQFLQAAGIGIGAAAVSCCGIGYLAARQPDSHVEFYEHTGDEMDDRKRKILIAYASKLGSTGGIAQAIGEELTARGNAVDVLHIGDAGDIARYDAVVAGSAVRRGQWLREALDWLQSNRAVLASKSVAYFTVCMTMAEDTPENRTAARGITGAARAVVEPAAEGFFGGRMDYREVSMIDQLVLRAKKIPEGDFRNWDAIRAWAQQLPAG